MTHLIEWTQPNAERQKNLMNWAQSNCLYADWLPENHETLLDVDHYSCPTPQASKCELRTNVLCQRPPEFLQMAAEANPQIAALLSEQANAVNPQLAVAQAHHHHHHNHHITKHSAG